MELGKLNTLTRQIIDKTIKEMQNFKLDLTPEEQLKNFFATLYNEDIIPDDNGKIEDLIDSASSKRAYLTGTKPSMGLSKEIVDIKQEEVDNATKTKQDEISRSEQVLNNTIEETNSNIASAEDNCNTTKIEAEENNNVAKENLENTKIECDANLKQAQDQEHSVEINANQKMEQADNNLSIANSQQASATEAYNDATEACNEAQNSTSQESNQALAQAQTQQAEAKEGLDRANEEQQKAEVQKAETESKCKEEIATAKENTEATKAEGEEKIKDAETNVTETKKESENSVKAAEKNIDIVKAGAETKVNTAENDLVVTKTENNTNVQEANQELAEAKKIAQDIINMARGYDNEGNRVKYNEKEYNEALNKITEKNIVQVLSAGNNDFVKAITGEASNNKKIQKRAESDCKKIVDIMNQYYEKTYKNYQHPTLGKMEELEEACSNLEFNMNFANELAVDGYNKLALSVMAGNVCQYIEHLENEISSINSNLNVNGKIDELFKQQTGNCWIHAAINSLSSTQLGKEIIQKNITRNPETGTTQVTLPGVGKIYNITDKELYDARYTLSNGEPDMTAYAIAIDRYIKENPEMRYDLLTQSLVKVDSSGQGNSPELAYSLLGAKPADKDFYDSNNIPIGTNSFHLSYNEEINKKYYDEICRLIKEGNAVFTLNKAGHAWSVIGVDEQGRLIVTESNNSREFANYFVGKDNTDVITDKEGYSQYNMHISFEDFKTIMSCISWRFK